MKQPTDDNTYIVLAPTGKSKTLSIAARRFGYDDRYSIVATCQSDTIAKRIVDGLHILQKKEVKLDTSTQRTLEAVRRQLIVEQSSVNQLRADTRDQGAKIRNLEAELRRVRDERYAAQRKALQEA